MSDFFDRQQAAQRQSWQLFFSFAVALLAVTALVAVCLYVIFFTFDLQKLYTHVTPFSLTPAEWDFSVIVRIAGGVLLLIAIGSLYKYLRLRSGGGSLIARMLGGRIVYPDSHDLHERRLLNVVEEMAIASGVTVPSVYLLDGEWGINAFAAGFSQEDAVLGITKGALHYLNREELQGVVAHEFSHILYGDMLINIRLQGFLHGILVLGLLGEMLVKSVMVDDEALQSRAMRGAAAGGFASLAAGVVLLVVGYTGVFFARLIKSGVCRQREFLADAAAVQFTRNPLGLAGALKKIGGLAAGARLRAPRASEISHMYFGNSATESRLQLFSTHPPLAERIRRLDPDFRGEYPARLQPVRIGEEEAMMYATPVADGGAFQGGREGEGGEHRFFRSFLAGREPDSAVSGQPEERLRLAQEMLAGIPASLRRAVTDGLGVRAVLCGLLLHRRDEVRSRQLAVLDGMGVPMLAQEVARFLPEIDRLLPELRLPLVDLALPALLTLTGAEYRAFRGGLARLIKAGGPLDLFAYALFFLLTRQRAASSSAASARGRQRQPVVTSLARVRDEVSCVLSLLARLGSEDEEAAGRAVMRAARCFGKEMKYIAYLPANLSGLDALDRALKRLGDCSPLIQQAVLEACHACIFRDERLSVGEAELYRVVVAALAGPLPPWLALAQPGGEV